MAKKENESIKDTKKYHEEMLSLLEVKAKREYKKELLRFFELAFTQYKEKRLIPREIIEEHQAKLFQISKKNIDRALMSGYERTANTFVKAKWITDEQRKKFKEDLKGKFYSFSINVSAKVSQDMTNTSKKNVLDIIDKVQEQQSNSIQKNDIFDLIAAAMLEAETKAITRCVVSATAICQTGINQGSIDCSLQTLFQTEIKLYKQWITMKDSKVRDSHRQMEGVSVDADDKFTVPRKDGGYDKMEYPGDMSASIGNWINCRCTMRYKSKL